jgi:hypothetical protein
MGRGARGPRIVASDKAFRNVLRRAETHPCARARLPGGRRLYGEHRANWPTSRKIAVFDLLREDPMATDTGRAGNPTMDATSLYREEIFTDRVVGTLRVLNPVKADGTADPSRPTIYTGEAQLMTNMGPLPISFDVPGASLSEAVAGYAEAAKEGVAHAMRELAEMRRQQSSSIVIPQGGALPPGGPIGGGKIQLP